jgi:hypothetical protein
MTTTDENRGHYGKYVVTNPDGTPAPGPLFILNYSRDHHARVALAAYADSCQATQPTLSINLRAELAKVHMTASLTHHQPVNPDAWRMRFAAHIEAGIRIAHLTGDALDTAQDFDRELTRAFAIYLNSTADTRRRRFLLQINTIAARVYSFYVQLDHPEIRETVDGILFDLAGLTATLTDPGST